MKKLGSVEKIEDFILAIAGGADVNGTWKGEPLIEHLFIESMRHTVIYPTGHPRRQPDVNLQKIQALISAGADVESLFYTAPGQEYYEFGNLMRFITRRLELFEIVWGSEQARKIISSQPIYRQDLKELHTTMQRIEHTLTNTKKGVVEYEI